KESTTQILHGGSASGLENQRAVRHPKTTLHLSLGESNSIMASEGDIDISEEELYP
ncbi:hypothetical protein L9F63_016722, partial [Diploptera punctata]